MCNILQNTLLTYIFSFGRIAKTRKKEIYKMNGLLFFVFGIMVFDYICNHKMNK